MSKIDNIFRNKLVHSKEAHPEHLWKAIEMELEGESKRPMGWIFITSAFILIAALLSFWYIQTPLSVDNTAIAGKQKQHQAIVKDNHNSANSPADVNTNDQSAINSTAQTNQFSTNEKDQYQNIGIHSESNIKNENNQEKTATSKDANLSKTGSVENGTYSNETNSFQSTHINETKFSNNSFNDIAGLNSNSTQPMQSEGHDIEVGNQSVIKWKIESTDNVTVNTISAPQIIKRKVSDRRRELFRAPFEISSRFELGKINAESTRLNDLNALASSLYIDCPTFSSDRTGMHLDLYMNHEMPFQSLSAMENGNALLALRKDSETSQYSYSYGGRISLVLPSGLSLRTGFNYSKINLSVSNDEMGTQLKSNNSHQLIEIPFLLGYEFGTEGSRIYYTANGGVLLNVRYTQEGNILNEDMFLSPIATAAEGKSAYSDSAGASLFGSFAIHYRWLERFDLYLEPNLRFMPSSLSSEVYTIDEKFATVGVMTGVRYRF